MKSILVLPQFFRFIVSGVFMAVACAVFVGLASQYINNNNAFLIVCSLIYLFLSLLNYFFQSFWVFNKKGSFVTYIFCCGICSFVFGGVNTSVLYFLNSRELAAVTFAYIVSVSVVVPLSYLLNKHLFTRPHEV